MVFGSQLQTKQCGSDCTLQTVSSYCLGRTALGLAPHVHMAFLPLADQRALAKTTGNQPPIGVVVQSLLLVLAVFLQGLHPVKEGF